MFSTAVFTLKNFPQVSTVFPQVFHVNLTFALLKLELNGAVFGIDITCNIPNG